MFSNPEMIFAYIALGTLAMAAVNFFETYGWRLGTR